MLAFQAALSSYYVLLLTSWGAAAPLQVFNMAEPPLSLRRKKLVLQYCLKLSANTNNPAYNAVFNSKFKTQFDNKPSQIRPLGFRIEDDLQNLGYKKKNVLPTTVSTILPWLLKRPNCNLSLCCYDKTTTNPEVFKCKFFELRSRVFTPCRDLHRWVQGWNENSCRCCCTQLCQNSSLT